MVSPKAESAASSIVAMGVRTDAGTRCCPVQEVDRHLATRGAVIVRGQIVVPGTADEGVVARLAVESIRTVATLKDVVATLAVEVVVRVATAGHAVEAGRAEGVVEAVSHAHRSFPPRAWTSSRPSRATMTSSPAVPLMTSRPLVPTMVAACPKHIGAADAGGAASRINPRLAAKARTR
jgi:hypothetical protein